MKARMTERDKERLTMSFACVRVCVREYLKNYNIYRERLQDSYQQDWRSEIIPNNTMNSVDLLTRLSLSVTFI